MYGLWIPIGASIIDVTFQTGLSANASFSGSLMAFLKSKDVDGPTPGDVLYPLYRIYFLDSASIEKPLQDLQAHFALAGQFDQLQQACAVLGLAVCSEKFATELADHAPEPADFANFVRKNSLEDFTIDDDQLEVLRPRFATDGFVAQLKAFMDEAWRHPGEASTYALCEGAVPTEKQELLHAVDSTSLVIAALDDAGVATLVRALMKAQGTDRNDADSVERITIQARQIRRDLKHHLVDELGWIFPVPFKDGPRGDSAASEA